MYKYLLFLHNMMYFYYCFMYNFTLAFRNNMVYIGNRNKTIAVKTVLYLLFSCKKYDLVF